jgi:hypothetical protein
MVMLFLALELLTVKKMSYCVLIQEKLLDLLNLMSSMGRVSQGVKVLLLIMRKVIGMEIIDDGVEILSVTSKGLW